MMRRVLTVAMSVVIGLGIGYWYGNSKDSLNLDKSQALINQLSNSDVTILQHFDAYANLEGFVIQSKSQQNGPVLIVYTDKAGRYLIAGNIFDDAGNNIAQQDYQTYVQPSAGPKAYNSASNTAYILEGNPDAPHQLYAVADPNCRFCHQLYNALQPYIQSGNLAVRWIIVAFVKSSSTSKAEAILGAKDPLKALALNEKGFKENEEEGGITGASNPVGQAKLATNMAFMKENGIMMTPTIIYKAQNGIMKIDTGIPQAKALNDLINSLGAGS